MFVKLPPRNYGGNESSQLRPLPKQRVEEVISEDDSFSFRRDRREEGVERSVTWIRPHFAASQPTRTRKRDIKY